MHYANKIFPGFDFILLQIVLQEIEIMNQGKTVFAQIMSLIPRYEFDKCVKRYNGNRHAIEFKCRDQFMVMSFAQFTGQDSLRSIDATLVALSYQVVLVRNQIYPTLDFGTYQRDQGLAHLSRLRSDIDCTSEIPVPP